MIIRFMFDEIKFKREIEDILIISAFEPNDKKTRQWIAHNTNLILDKCILDERIVICNETNNVEHSMELVLDVAVKLPSGTWLTFNFKISPVDLLPK